MGLTHISRTITALRRAGISVDRGFPAAPMPHPAAPAAAVTVATVTKETVALAVTVFTAAEQGGAVCEDTALTVCDTLTEQGARCTMRDCGFNRKSGMFSVTVLAQWNRALPCTVMLNGTALPYVTNVSARQETDLMPTKNAATGELSLIRGEWYWKVTVEELLPVTQQLPVDQTEAFSISIRRSGGTEQYTDCFWESVVLEDTSAGVRRLRVAKTRKERTFTA